MNQTDTTTAAGPAKVSMGTKISYIGTGVLIGLIIYPFVRKTLAKVQPRVDALFDDLTGKAEDMIEKTTDFMAKARSTAHHDHDHHDHNHDHGHGHSHSHDNGHKNPGDRKVV